MTVNQNPDMIKAEIGDERTSVLASNMFNKKIGYHVIPASNVGRSGVSNDIKLAGASFVVSSA